VKKYFKTGGLVLILLVVVIQFLPPGKNISKEVQPTDFINMFKVPEKVQQTLHVTCYDCHSNNTRYPWYSKIQPVGWYLQNHIKNGKAELNFSEFGSYSNRRQNSKISSIIDEVRDNKMPLSSYTLIHRDARLSVNSKKELLDFLTSVRDSIK